MLLEVEVEEELVTDEDEVEELDIVTTEMILKMKRSYSRILLV